MTAISYHHTVNDVQDPDCWGEGPFARRAWFALLEEAGSKPLIALASDGHDKACLPLTRGPRGLESLTNWYAFSWHAAATSSGSTGPLVDLARDLVRHTSRIDLAKVPDENGLATHLESAFRAAGWLVVREQCDSNHIVHLCGRNYAQYLADRPGNLRTTLKRKAGKVEVSLATAFSPQDWAAYEAVYAESWKDEEGDPALLRAFAQQESRAGRYRFALARHAGEAVAAQFWSVDGTAAYIHKLAHARDATALSPGTTLTAALMQRVIDVDRVAMVDFGTGNDSYKRDWMEAVRPRWQITCLRPDAPGNWPTIAWAALRKLVSSARSG